jgi:hypothetical protein
MEPWCTVYGNYNWIQSLWKNSMEVSKKFENRTTIEIPLLEYIYMYFSHTLHIQFVLFLFYHFYIYSHVYTLFGPPPLLLLPPCTWAEPIPPSCAPILLKRKHKK